MDLVLLLRETMQGNSQRFVQEPDDCGMKKSFVQVLETNMNDVLGFQFPLMRKRRTRVLLPCPQNIQVLFRSSIKLIAKSELLAQAFHKAISMSSSGNFPSLRYTPKVY